MLKLLGAFGFSSYVFPSKPDKKAKFSLNKWGWGSEIGGDTRLGAHVRGRMTTHVSKIGSEKGVLRF